MPMGVCVSLAWHVHAWPMAVERSAAGLILGTVPLGGVPCKQLPCLLASREPANPNLAVRIMHPVMREQDICKGL